jgi:circadian clock protein KaiC
MLKGGYKRGTSVLIAGTPGTGKTTVASTFIQAACARGEKTLFLAFEESEEAVIANMLSPGIDLRSALRAVTTFQLRLVVLDALSSLLRMGTEQAAFDYAIRLLLACKERGVTCLFTNQLFGTEAESSFAGVGISSLVDTLILLRFAESDGMLHRTLLVRKVRGGAHSAECHEFRITDRGIELLGVYRGSHEGRLRP